MPRITPHFHPSPQRPPLTPNFHHSPQGTPMLTQNVTPGDTHIHPKFSSVMLGTVTHPKIPSLTPPTPESPQTSITGPQSLPTSRLGRMELLVGEGPLAVKLCGDNQLSAGSQCPSDALCISDPGGSLLDKASPGRRVYPRSPPHPRAPG